MRSRVGQLGVGRLCLNLRRPDLKRRGPRLHSPTILQWVALWLLLVSVSSFQRRTKHAT